MLLALCKCQSGQRLQVWPSTDTGGGGGGGGDQVIVLLAFCRCQSGQRLQVWPSTDRGGGCYCIVLLAFC